MRKLIFFLFSLSFITACENNENISIQTPNENPIYTTNVAVLEVEGMMCKKGCGALIRKGLYGTQGVSSVEVLFKEDRKVNEIKVYFDIDKVSTEEMVEIVENLANKRYSARIKKVTESTISETERRQEEDGL